MSDKGTKNEHTLKLDPKSILECYMNVLGAVDIFIRATSKVSVNMQ